MVVEATCADCNDVHPLGDRPFEGITTRCPSCGSTRYVSSSTDGKIMKSEAERIADAVRDVDGVGDDTLANIQTAFSTYVELENAHRRQLMGVDGVGQKTADRILNRF